MSRQQRRYEGDRPARSSLRCTIPIFFAVLAMGINFGYCQDVRVNGGFLSDSLKIGQEAGYFLSAHYPQDLTILFPDSSFSFYPFEYSRKTYFTTRTKDGISADSAIYYLTTFEVDRVQHLDLPIYIVQSQDCTTIVSPRDSILLTQLVAQVPDSISIDKLPLKMNTAYQRVHLQFNFWMFMIGVGIVVFIAIMVVIFFGKRISRFFTVRRLQRNHREFVLRYNAFLAQLEATFSRMTTESALAAWKKYMEQLEARPYTKLTTRETMALLRNDQLGSMLHSLDKAIYGHDTRVIESLHDLRHFAEERFSQKMEQVRHGK